MFRWLLYIYVSTSRTRFSEEGNREKGLFPIFAYNDVSLKAP